MPRYVIHWYPTFNALPARCRGLLQAEIDRLGLYREPEWFEHLMRHYFDEDVEMRLYCVEDAESHSPLLLVPMRYSRVDPAARKAHVISVISHPENHSIAPFCFGPGLLTRPEILSVLSAFFAYLRRANQDAGHVRFDVIRIWPLERDSPLSSLIHQALKQAGFIVQLYNNSYNRFEVTEGLTYEDYFKQRSANTRYHIRRCQRNLEKHGKVEFSLITRPDQLKEAVHAYIDVSDSSWKAPGTMYSLEGLQLIGLCAQKGYLRMGILRLDDVPVAADFWIVTNGSALCTRLAYHEEYKKLAPGVVLTHFMLQHILDEDHARVIDFGFGPDEYKGRWMNESRNYYGYMGFNPMSARGFTYAITNILGSKVKQGIKHTLGKLGWQRFKPSAEA